MRNPKRPPRGLVGRVQGRDGFTIAEMVMAMLVLTVGLLAMAGGTSVVIRTVDTARTDTGRTAALQTGIETVRAMDYDDIAAGESVVGEFTVSWTVLSSEPLSTLLRFQVVGPGRAPGSSAAMPALSRTVTTNLNYRIARP